MNVAYKSRMLIKTQIYGKITIGYAIGSNEFY